ncbi:histidine phosphatase superfamily, partial [Penicillium sp. IBT 16267x]
HGAVTPHSASWKTWFHPLQAQPNEITVSSEGWNLFQHLGGNGPWIEKSGSNDEFSNLAPPEGCSVDQVHMISRHGERYPTPSAGNRHLQLLERIRALQVPLNGSLSFLNNWTYFTDDPSRDFGQLTSTGPYAGTLGAFTTGVRFRTRYGNLLPKDATTRFWASDSQRVIATARYFASGLFGLDWASRKTAALHIIPETFERGADTLTPGETCRDYVEDKSHGHDLGARQLALFQNWYIPGIAQRLLKDNPALGTLADMEVYSMQEMCASEIMVRGSSPWCDVFTRQDWDHFEYARDLLHYYRAGPGNAYAQAMGWLWLNATSTLLQTGIEAGTMFLSFSSAHDGDIVPILTALGILSVPGEIPLSPNYFIADRLWRTSSVLPMGARMIVERLTSSDKNDIFIRININDRIVSLPFCRTGPGDCCSLENFLEYVNSQKGSFGDYGHASLPHPRRDHSIPQFDHHFTSFYHSSSSLSQDSPAEYLSQWSTTPSLQRSAPEMNRATFCPGVMFTKSDESRNPRRPPEESGPFGKRRNARYEHARSRTRTGTPAKRENPNVAEFGRLFAQQVDEDKINGLPKSNSSSSLDNPRKQTEKVATECFLYGYKAKDSEWKVIDKYERISQGMICEDYPRSDPNSTSQYAQLLSGGDVVIRANLSADANRKSKRYAGGFHWIKVTFDSSQAADRACFYSPQEVDGHLVFCELYHGHGPAEDTAIPADSNDDFPLRSRASRTLTSTQSTSFLSSKDQDRLTLPRSFAMNNLSSVMDAPEPEEGSSFDSSTATFTTGTATGTTVTATGASTGLDRSSSLHQRNVPTPVEPKPESEYMTHIPTVRRTKLRPLAEALPPQPTVTERVLRSIPILSWFTGDIVGDGPQFREDGAFDYDKSNSYWRFWYMVDKILGTDICGLKEES